jgi:hypothetical protein
MFEKYITHIFENNEEAENESAKIIHSTASSIRGWEQYQSFLKDKKENDTLVWFDYSYPMASRKGLGILRNGKIISHCIFIMS